MKSWKITYFLDKSVIVKIDTKLNVNYGANLLIESNSHRAVGKSTVGENRSNIFESVSIWFERTHS